jgi:virginiamycin B lyase
MTIVTRIWGHRDERSAAKRRQKLLACILIAASLSIATGARAAKATSLLSLPAGTQAFYLTEGPGEDVWYSGIHVTGGFDWKSVIGRVGPSGETTDFPLPGGRSAGSIVAGPDGDLWFTEGVANAIGSEVAKIGRVSPSGQFSEYRLDNAVGWAGSIALGADENLWFTERFERSGKRRSEIGHISSAGKVTRFPLPARDVPIAIVAGPEGNLWFTERPASQARRRGPSKIGRITLKGRITQFPLPDKSRVPGLIAVGPDGNLWFAEAPAPYGRQVWPNKIGRITPSGSITQFSVPGRGGTRAVAAGPGGAIWFIAGIGTGSRSAIDSVTPEGKAAQPTCIDPSCELLLNALAARPDGQLWFAGAKRPIGKVPFSEEPGFVGVLRP